VIGQIAKPAGARDPALLLSQSLSGDSFFMQESAQP
jgi:hypothetical protein